MIIRITQKYMMICDRCGKAKSTDEHEITDEFHEIVFTDGGFEPIAKGLACSECYKDFCELAENFFDDVNRGSRHEAQD